MWWLLPVGVFAFVLGTLASLNRIVRNESWVGYGIVAALAATAMTLGWMDIASQL